MRYWQIFLGFEWEGRPYGPLERKTSTNYYKGSKEIRVL